MYLKAIGVFLYLIVRSQSEERHTSKLDSINVEEILNSERLLKNYVNCLMDRGPCTAEGNELKEILPGALESDCQKCTNTQKEKEEKIILFLAKNKKSLWKELEEKYDPNGKYRKRYQKKHGVDLDSI